MIKYIKLDNNILQNIEPYTIDEEGNQILTIPSDLEELRKVAIDTFSWLIGYTVKQKLGDEFAKMSAWNSKAIVLLAKQLNSLNPNAELTDKEQTAYNKLLQLADNGYADSDLLVNSFAALDEAFAEYNPKIQAAISATTVEELIALLS